jgi:hypothetical protein
MIYLSEGTRNLFTNFSHLERERLVGEILSLILLLSVSYEGILTARKDHLEPTRYEFQHLRTHLGKRRLGVGLALGLGVGLGLGLALFLLFWFISGFEFRLAVGLGLGLGVGVGVMYGLMYGLKPLEAVAVDPRDPLRNDLVLWIVIGLGLGLAGVFGAVGAGLAAGLVVKLAIGFLGGLIIGLMFLDVGNAWLRYSVSVCLAVSDRLQPMRLGAFLQWANNAGILRISGNAYQFRHNELRDWLQQEDSNSNTVPKDRRLV